MSKWCGMSFVFRCLIDVGILWMVNGGLLFPGTGCSVLDIGNIMDLVVRHQ